MSNFKQAIKWMQEGKKIMRKIWRDPKYRRGLMMGAVVDLKEEPQRRYLYRLEDFLADDWEICKEDLQ